MTLDAQSLSVTTDIPNVYALASEGRRGGSRHPTPPPLTLLEGGVNVESWNWDRGRTQRLPRSKLPAIFPDVERTKGGANRFVMEEPVPEPSLL